ncbi:MAG: aminotransferase class III-fold pyridoxal phosphate-dependent enzyme [Gemmatimonadaceae bacterium]
MIFNTRASNTDSNDHADRDADDVDPDAELAAAEDPGLAWRSRAEAVIPGSSSTGSKRPEALFGPGEIDAPAHFVRAVGCTVEAIDGSRFVDCTMALGSVALGYADPSVTQAVVAAAVEGSVAGLPHAAEVEVAERLCSVIPCAEQLRFLKTGAEAVAAAVRIARTYTGRDHVIGSGYFGWLDWWSDAAGIPRGAHADFTPVPFDDVAALNLAAAEHGGRLAAVVLEPVVERLPSDAWVAAARALCDREGAVLIFDEIKTGFRLRPGGYQELSGVTPDLATFGKAMANGFPLAAVVGRGALMEVAKRTWISSTLAGEGTALAAASAVLDRYEEDDVCAELARIGGAMRDRVGAAVRASRIEGIAVQGIDPMWLLRFTDTGLQDRFLRHALRLGALFKRGAYNFAALAHDDAIIERLEGIASNALVAAREDIEHGR